MVKCTRCGYEGSKKDVKRSPNLFSDFKDKLICDKCFKELKDEYDKKLMNNISLKFNDNKKEDVDRCKYCGSFIKKDIDVCPHCNYHFHKNKVFKREKTVKLKADKEHSKVEYPIEFPKTHEQIKSSLPKFYRYLPMISGIIFIAICLVLAGQAGVFNGILEDSNDGLIYGSWELQDMYGTADDDFKQIWTFCENQSLKVETEFEKKSSIYNSDESKEVYYLYWEIYDGVLRISRDYSDFAKEVTFNIVPKYDYKFIKGGTTLDLTFRTSNIDFDLDMQLKKINEGLFG